MSPFTSFFVTGANSYFIHSAWKHEKRASYIYPKKLIFAPKISKKWKNN